MNRFLLAMAFISLLGTWPASAEELPLTGPAYLIAEEAYRAYDRGDYQTAVRQAKEAVRLRPDLSRLQTLLRKSENALRPKRAGTTTVAPASTPSAEFAMTRTLNEINQLQSNGELEKALARVQTSLAAMPDPNNVLLTRKKILSALLANQFSAKAIAAQQAAETDTAITEIRQAIAYAPDVALYHLFYIDLLIKKERYADAWHALEIARKAADDQGMLHFIQAYLLQHRNRYADAREHYLAALNSDELNDIDLDNMRLITADAAFAEIDPAFALAVLSPMQGQSPDMTERRQFAQLMADGKTLFIPALNTPRLRCIASVPEPVCSFFASYPPSEVLVTAAGVAAQDNQLDQALALIGTAASISKDTPELIAKRNTIYRLLAQQYAAKTYQALGDNDLELAEASSRKAIAYAPDNMTYHLLLINTLDRKKRYGAGEQAATQAITVDDEDVVPRVLRGYFKQRQHHYSGARDDYAQALNSDVLSDDDMRLLRLYVADAATAAHDREYALQVLSPLPDKDPEAQWRRQLLQPDAKNRALVLPLQAPPLDCRLTPYGTACSVGSDANANDQLVSVIYRQIGLGDTATAATFAASLSQRYPDEQKYSYVNMQAQQAASQTHTTSNATAPSYVPTIDLGYKAAMANAPQQALQIFQDMERANALPPSGLQHVAYAAINANQRALASQYLRKTVDAVHDKKMDMTPQTLFETRRSVAELEREWGFYVAGSYSAGNTDSRAANNTLSNYVSDSLQLGTEAYWRPPSLVKDGRYLDIYGRVTTTAYNKSGPKGAETLQAATGVRYKPFSDINIIAAFERQIPVGSTATGDWLARVAYSDSKGTDLRVDVPGWLYRQIYVEAGYYLQSKTKYLVTETQIGRSYRMDNWSKNTVLTPHAVLAADYNDAFTTPGAVGAGAGVAIRHWFREDRYNAPRSYVDFSVQYRFRLAGDSRANGIVVRALFNY